MAVRGTTWDKGAKVLLSDLADDLMLPFGMVGGGAAHTNKYEQVIAILDAHRNVDTLLGHSLGGAVVRQITKERPWMQHRVYGTPGFMSNDLDSYRHTGDPVSVFDTGGTTTVRWGNPHSFED